MLQSEFDNGPKSINVAVATDTMLYAPFFMAYYGGDFDHTPFGKFNVNIIGKEEDNRFKPLRLKGDGFATFCTIFGLSDISICDPSFLVFLTTCPLDMLKKLCEDFFDILTEYGKSSVKKKNKSLFHSTTEELLPNALKREIEENYKVLGGLISKLAFSVVGSSEIETLQQNKSFDKVELFGTNPLEDTAPQTFTRQHIRQFIFYDHPSTGNCVGKIYAEIYDKMSNTDSISKDFGQELVYLTNGSDRPAIAISCDYVAIDYRKEVEQINDHKIFEIKDFTKSSDGYLFTGFMGNVKQITENRIMGFLYCIDKNLYEIDYYLRNEEITGLVNYIKSKLPRDKDMMVHILRMLVADADCFESIKKKINDDKDSFQLDNVIGMYARRLSEWHAFGKTNKLGLYYNDIEIGDDEINDLSKIYELRKKAYKKGALENADKEAIKNSVVKEVLKDWRLKEKEIIRLNWNTSKRNPQMVKPNMFLLAIFSPLLLVNLLIRLFKKKTKVFMTLRTKTEYVIWKLLSKQTFLFWLGAAFIIFEILTGIAHLTGFHLPRGENTIIPGTIIKVSWIVDLFFAYATVIIVVSVMIGYGLIRKKQSEQFVYRNEQ